MVRTTFTVPTDEPKVKNDKAPPISEEIIDVILKRRNELRTRRAFWDDRPPALAPTAVRLWPLFSAVFRQFSSRCLRRVFFSGLLPSKNKITI